MKEPSRDASYYSYAWDAAGPTDPIQEQLFHKQLFVLPDSNGPRKYLADIMQSPSVMFNLQCRLWRFTPLIAPGKLGTPIKVFTCETDGTRVIPGQPTAKGSPGRRGMPSSGEQLEMYWGVRKKTGRKGEDWPAWLHLTRPFIEKVTVTMGFAGDVDARLIIYSPITDSQHGSVSSSISHSFNLGMFGATGTLGVSADYSHSNSMELTDYGIHSESNANTSKHTISMSMLDGGLQYSGWESAPENAKLPGKATSDMFLGMQGIWELPDLKDELVFKITVSVSIGMLMGKKWIPGMTQRFALTNPGKTVYMDPETFGPGIPAHDLKGNIKIAYEPLKPEDGTHAMTTFNWERAIKVPLAAADRTIPTR